MGPDLTHMPSDRLTMPDVHSGGHGSRSPGAVSTASPHQLALRRPAVLHCPHAICDTSPNSISAKEVVMGADYTYEISYGKLRVPLYRVYARPLTGVAPIPESAFTGRANTLVALEVDVEVLGDAFLSAYTEGDNSRVVATDSMKNVILRQALAYDGATLEGLLAHLGRHFLATYKDMQALRLTARETPFAAARVPTGDAGQFADSNVLFARGH